MCIVFILYVYDESTLMFEVIFFKLFLPPNFSLLLLHLAGELMPVVHDYSRLFFIRILPA
jgi:hypothetical protein